MIGEALLVLGQKLSEKSLYLPFNYCKPRTALNHTHTSQNSSIVKDVNHEELNTEYKVMKSTNTDYRYISRASLVAQLVKNPPAVQETPV